MLEMKLIEIKTPDASHRGYLARNILDTKIMVHWFANF